LDYSGGGLRRLPAIVTRAKIDYETGESSNGKPNQGSVCRTFKSQLKNVHWHNAQKNSSEGRGKEELMGQLKPMSA